MLGAAKQAEDLLLAAGWRPKVQHVLLIAISLTIMEALTAGNPFVQIEQMEKYWIFDARQDSKDWK